MAKGSVVAHFLRPLGPSGDYLKLMMMIDDYLTWTAHNAPPPARRATAAAAPRPPARSPRPPSETSGGPSPSHTVGDSRG